MRTSLSIIGAGAAAVAFWGIASCGDDHVLPASSTGQAGASGIAALRSPFDAAHPADSGMVLTFADEFDDLSASDGGPADGKRWVNHIWFRGGAGEAEETSRALSVAKGVLTIKAWDDGRGWKSGTLQSTDGSGRGFAQKFGYFEARIKVPAGQGLLPTFYLMSNEHVKQGAAPASEFDILEGKGSAPREVYTTLHRDSAHAGDRQNHPNRIRVAFDLSQDFHRFGMLWAPDVDHVTFYLDGRPILEAPKFDTTDGAPAALILQLILGTWVGKPDAATPNPALMQVDYVRVWQFPGLANGAQVQAVR